MSIHLYDEALSKKISGWLGGSSIRIIKPDECARLFQMKSNQGSDKDIKLPFVSIARESEIDIRTTKKPMSFDGMNMQSEMNIETTINARGKEVAKKFNGGKSVNLNALPMILRYQIDIYAQRMIDAEIILRDLMFKLVNKPKLVINIPYNSASIVDKDGKPRYLQHTAYISTAEQIHDNSDLNTNKLYFDEFTRFTIRLEIDDAYMWSVPVVSNVMIDQDRVPVLDENELKNR